EAAEGTRGNTHTTPSSIALPNAAWGNGGNGSGLGGRRQSRRSAIPAALLYAPLSHEPAARSSFCLPAVRVAGFCKRVRQKKPRRLTGATYRRCYGHGPLVL